MKMQNYPIDIVVPWVDGSDPEWRAVRSHYRPGSGNDNNEARYREWGLFKYWFRSIEQYAPWVRTVHLVTWGHVPEWLNVNHPKLNVVKHTDYIPEEYLPTFNAIPIENNVHRIKDLAEHFILFNDDVYLNALTTPEDFFVDGVPRDTAVLNGVTISDTASFMPYLALNCLGIINENFTKKEALKKNLKKWFSVKYGKLALRNIYYYPGRNFQGFRNFHTCVPYTKSEIAKIWEKYPDVLGKSCMNKFRSRDDVNHYVFRYWRLAEGSFVPQKPNCIYLTIGENDAQDVKKALSGDKYKVVCVNDDPSNLNFEEEQKKFKEIFDERFFVPSSYEKI